MKTNQTDEASYFIGMKRKGQRNTILTAKERELIYVLTSDFYNEHEMCQAFEEEICVAESVLRKVKEALEQ